MNTIAVLEEEENAVVLDTDAGSSYHQLLTGGKIMVEGETGFYETKIYRFLAALYDLLQGAGERPRRVASGVEPSYAGGPSSRVPGLLQPG